MIGSMISIFTLSFHLQDNRLWKGAYNFSIVLSRGAFNICDNMLLVGKRYLVCCRVRLSWGLKSLKRDQSFDKDRISKNPLANFIFPNIEIEELSDILTNLCIIVV